MPLRDKDVVNDKKKKNKTKTKLIYDHFPNTISTPLRDKHVVNDKKKQEKQIYTTKQKKQKNRQRLRKNRTKPKILTLHIFTSAHQSNDP